MPAPPSNRKGWPWTEESIHLSEKTTDGFCWPSITVVTPSFNQGEFIEETIRSVLLQGYPNIEYMIIDGGSTDKTIDIIRKYENWIFFWVSEPDRGQAHGLNKGFSRAEGDVLAWLNSDDLYLANSLQTIGMSFIEKPESSVFVGSGRRIDNNGKLLGYIVPKNVNKQGIVEWGVGGNFCQQACFFSSELWFDFGPFDETLNLAFDYDFWLKIISNNNVSIVPVEIGVSRVHASAKTQEFRYHMHAETMAVQVRHGHTDAAANRLRTLINRHSIFSIIRSSVKTKLFRIMIGTGLLQRDRKDS